MARKVFDTMKRRHYECPNCLETFSDIRWGKDFLPHCKHVACSNRPMLETCPPDQKAPYVIGDDIPGGMEVRHGICHEDGTPRKVYSKTELKRVASESGWTIMGDTPKPNSRVTERLQMERESREKSR